MQHSFTEIRIAVMEAKRWLNSLERHIDQQRLGTMTMVRIHRKHFKKPQPSKA